MRFLFFFFIILFQSFRCVLASPNHLFQWCQANCVCFMRIFAHFMRISYFHSLPVKNNYPVAKCKMKPSKPINLFGIKINKSAQFLGDFHMVKYKTVIFFNKTGELCRFIEWEFIWLIRIRNVINFNMLKTWHQKNKIESCRIMRKNAEECKKMRKNAEKCIFHATLNKFYLTQMFPSIFETISSMDW